MTASWRLLLLLWLAVGPTRAWGVERIRQDYFALTHGPSHFVALGGGGDRAQAKNTAAMLHPSGGSFCIRERREPGVFSLRGGRLCAGGPEILA